LPLISRAYADAQRLMLRSGISFGEALIASLVELKLAERFAQPLAGLVQLRLRITYRAAQKVCDFAMSVPLDIMQDKNLSETRGQSLDAASKIYSVDRALDD
jgi:hypothetical protein